MFFETSAKPPSLSVIYWSCHWQICSNKASCSQTHKLCHSFFSHSLSIFTQTQSSFQFLESPKCFVAFLTMLLSTFLIFSSLSFNAPSLACRLCCLRLGNSQKFSRSRMWFQDITLSFVFVLSDGIAVKMRACLSVIKGLLKEKCPNRKKGSTKSITIPEYFFAI